MLPGSCSGPSEPSPPPPPPPPQSTVAQLIGAGDIVVCGSSAHVATAALLRPYPGATVFTAGDNVYPNGHPNDWRNCYDPWWGEFKDRTRPGIGNHDYETQNGKPYYDYWGDQAGPRDAGYYTYTLGAWRIYAINSEIDTRPGSTQYSWLQNELNINHEPCAAAIWHKPLYSSGVNGPQPHMRDMFRLLYNANAEIVISGHDHDYEVFFPQDADGRRDDAKGVRQFVVGTGGVELTGFPRQAPNSAYREMVQGVILFELQPNSYSWQFISPQPPQYRNNGNGVCH
jgi:hypothetical protein